MPLPAPVIRTSLFLNLVSILTQGKMHKLVNLGGTSKVELSALDA